jgi:Protein of unknown function (DUF1549)/Protein of unknown function (DUF1553)
MKLHKILAFAALGLAVLTLSLPAGAADGDKNDKTDKKAQKKAALKKMMDKKGAKEEAKKPDDATLKPAPTNIQAPAAPAKPMAVADFAKMIDSRIDKSLNAAMVKPSAKSDDAEFLRRVSLDLAGVIPTAEQAARFLDDKSPDKRAKLVDDLLASKNFGKRMGDIWTGLMYPVDSDNRFVSKVPLRDWLTDQFNANMHWDRMSYELITATGDYDKNGAGAYLIANRGVDKMTDSVTKLFLGVMVSCAQCHNHPFASIKQDEYWGVAQFFMKTNVSNPRAAKDGGTISISEEGRVNRKANPVPESVKDVAPKFLGGDKMKINAKDPARPVLAQWITAPTNPYFAKAFVNRAWEQIFGKGIIKTSTGLVWEAVEPSHPELFEQLAKEFTASGFDIKHLFRGMVNSEAYQRSSRPLGDNRDDKTLYSHQAIKVLSPEQLFDSLISVVGELGRADVPRKGGNMAPKGLANSPRDQFAAFFRGGEDATPVEYETGIPQALRLMNGPLAQNGRLMTAANTIIGTGKVTSANAAFAAEKLYLATLSRRPTSVEVKRVADYVAKSGNDPKTAYGDVLWALINSSEFALCR